MRQNVLLRMAQAAMLFSIIIETTPLTRAAPLSLAFTYQGQLSDGLNRASGFYDFTFALYDAASLGNQVGDAIQIDGVPVSNGVFTVTLDFGSAFNGNARWLEIHVRTNLAADAVILSPRQPMRATPYALFSRTSGALNGILPDSQLSGNIARLNAPQVFTATVGFSPSSGSPFTVSSSERVPNLNADLLDGLDSLAFAPASHDHGNTYWKLLGNAGTT